MQKTQNPTEIILPNNDLSREIAELSTDIKYSAVFALGGTALTAAGIAGAYSMVTGEHVLPVVDDVFIGSGVLTSGVGMGAAGIGRSVSLRMQRRELRKQERQELTTAREHYQQNQELYQAEALKDASAAGISVNGWHIDEK
jgi:hypothetical protein